jgi:MraZ protein
MFAGRFEYAIDDKNRVSIPAKFREILATNFDMRLYLTNLDGCIVAYPYQEWLDIQNRLSDKDSVRKEARTFLRFYYSGVTECSIDRLGRILIPQSLKNFANIQKDVTIIGMNRKIEIWAQEVWEDLVGKAMSDRDLMADILSELGL